MNVKSLKCPILVQVLMWIASQLSILYGEVNAKCFAIHVLKLCLLEAANEVVVFLLDSCLKEMDEGDDRVIFVTQVAAAVAALHERSILEAKIKLLRVPQQLPRYQRMAELSFVSKRADDERSKRPNYKAIIEHDGLPRKHLSNQESNKTKTKEELLAEERDYKRRRMSYRGKKLKRTTLQVMRDIIDGYMEEIKLAGGIGRFEKGTEEEEMSSKPPSAPEVTDLFRQYYEQQGRSNHGHHEKLEYQRSAKQDRHGREYSRSPERYRSRSRSHERSSHQRGRDDAKLTRSKDHEKRLSSKSYVDYKSLSSGLESADGMQRDDQKLNTYGNHGSNSVAQNAFDDRYDPTESHDMHEDDVYTGITYAREEVHD
ncbi:hypothetical protein OIU85_003654 [Salix viminalis]|uniref:CHHC U11-48K-type domain-containing protein n=1 Tax=Salix viminalis TaxID=40686 RepID=A0A9Q0T1M9_SALVM|nr:hypothetical protein OIU85_003654 [Salix viminalis]